MDEETEGQRVRKIFLELVKWWCLDCWPDNLTHGFTSAQHFMLSFLTHMPQFVLDAKFISSVPSDRLVNFIKAQFPHLQSGGRKKKLPHLIDIRVKVEMHGRQCAPDLE